MASAEPARTVHLALGSNLGDREGNLAAARAALGTWFRVEAASAVYETEPAYRLDQPRFLNQCLRARTTLPVRDALVRLKEIERALGREPTERNAPRPIDLDLLFYGDMVMDTPDLTVPHPRVQERAFVLVPLAEIAPDLRVNGETVGRLLARVDLSGVERLTRSGA